MYRNKQDPKVFSPQRLCKEKASKSRKEILKFSFEPTSEKNIFCISALDSKKRSNKKKNYTSNWRILIILNIPHSFYRTGQKYKNIFIHFLAQMKTLKFAFEIYWPLHKEITYQQEQQDGSLHNN